MKIRLGQEQKAYFQKVINSEMKNKKSFLKKAPIDERKLFMRAAEINLQYATTFDIGKKHVSRLIKKVKRHGITKGIIKDREGLKLNPQIKHVLKNTKLLKNALIKYLDAQ